MKKLLILNLGSTSFKFKLYSYENELSQLATGEIGNISNPISDCEIKCGDKVVLDEKIHCACHFDAFKLCIDKIKEIGLLNDLSELSATCYKAVHGGKISGTRVVDEELLNVMKQMIPLAPKHNPVYIELMEAIRNNYPNLLQLAHFETAFHATIPEYRVVYGVPYSWYKDYGIRRYGFHGASHEYISLAAKKLCPKASRIISIHLGGSCSCCAIQNGKSIASSMGATPQSGLLQNNRVGDLDCFTLNAVEKQVGGFDKVYSELSNNGGLKGLSGVSNDMREVIEAADNGNQQAKLTIDAFVDNIVGYIGMFTAYLGGLDAIIFTGGIGTRSSYIREHVVNKLGFVKAILDSEKNNAKNKEDHLVSAENSAVEIWAVTTDEEYVLAKDTINYIQNN